MLQINKTTKLYNSLKPLNYKKLKLPTVQKNVTIKSYNINNTAIPYRASTGPEQGFTCVVFPQRGKPVFNTGFPSDENRFFLVRNTKQGKPCFHYSDGFAVNNHQNIQ